MKKMMVRTGKKFVREARNACRASTAELAGVPARVPRIICVLLRQIVSQTLKQKA
jgi:Trm5-related predicted tRNA methylase